MYTIQPIIDKFESYNVKHDLTNKTINISASITFSGDITVSTELYDMDENNEFVITEDFRKYVARVIAWKMLDALEISEEDIRKLDIVRDVSLSELVMRYVHIDPEAMYQLCRTIAMGKFDPVDWEELDNV